MPANAFVVIKGEMYPVVIELVELLDETSMSLHWSFDGMEDNTMVRDHANKEAIKRNYPNWTWPIRVYCLENVFCSMIGDNTKQVNLPR